MSDNNYFTESCDEIMLDFCGLSPCCHVKLFQNALNPTLKQCKQLAWYGDSILNYTITQILFEKYIKDENEFNDLKTVHDLREKYKTNQSLACYLKYGAVEVYNMIIEENDITIDELNDHSIGTIFEALLCWAHYEDLSAKQLKKAAVTQIVENLMNWVDSEEGQLLVTND
ncbi:hypothetical protein ABK040_010763 [Willaertia magna]